MKVVRVFIKPAGTSWADFPIPDEGTDMMKIMPMIKLEGMFIKENAMVPIDAILFCALLTIPDNTPPALVFPTGKPN